MLKLLVAFLLCFSMGFSQDKEPAVMLNARAQKTKILLRWALNSPAEWKKAHKKGFMVTRTTLKKDGQIIEKPEKVILTPKPLLPEPVDSWIDLVQKDNNAAIIAQAIFGESFQVGSAHEGELSKLINIADDLDQRYTFSLYAADMSFDSALKAGWGFVDNDVKENEVYAYQVSVFESPNVKQSAFVVGLKDFNKLPIISDFNAIPDDKKIQLSWDYETYKRIYTSFKIERSEDGVNYIPISPQNIANLNDSKENPAKRMVFVDTISVNNKPFQYRLSGITSFGELSEPSKPITAAGISETTTAPSLTNYNLINSNDVSLIWEYPQKDELLIQGFEVEVSEQDRGIFKKVSALLPPSQRKLQYKAPLSASNYFRVAAIAKNNQRLVSQTMLVQPADSIPPAKPTGLEGSIDSLGVVRLQWKTNIERDLKGYRILRANNKDEEYIDVFGKSFVQNNCQDQLSFKLSNSKVYYRLVAEDLRYNMSEPSDVLVLQKPDKIPPTSPIFKNYEIKDGKIYLQWIKSYSEDVVLHSLRKREKGSEKWTELKQINDDTQEYIDDKITNKTTYQYAILAKDQSELWSPIEQSTLTVTAVSFSAQKAISYFRGIADRDNRKIILNWSYTKTKDKVVSASIYKNLKGSPPSLWKEISANTTSVEDSDLSINTEYEYHLVPNLENDTPTKTETITVNY